MALSFLLGLKRQMINGWGYAKSAVKVDDNTMIMKVGGMEVLRAGVHNQTLCTEWLNKEWQSWEELQSSKKLKELMDKGAKSLYEAFQKRGKGDGKGFMKGAAGSGTTAK